MPYSHEFRAARDGERRFYDAHGEPWLVFEHTFTAGSRPPRRCLVFESPLIMRRVCSYPESWRALDSRGLEELSWAR